MNSVLKNAKSMPVVGLLVLCQLALLASGCAGRVAPVARTGELPTDFPVGRYERAAAQGAAVYRVDPDRSLLQIVAGRDGALARMGHDHLVASRDLQGYLMLTADGTHLQADIVAPLDRMSVDEPGLRADAGLPAEVPDDAREGTRANMLASLEADDYPWVSVGTDALLPGQGAREVGANLRVIVILHGVSREIEVPVSAVIDADHISAETAFTIRQTDFGVEPYSVFGGALRVKDELSIRARLQAFRQ